MAKRDDTVGRMAEGKHLVACSESDIGWIAGSSIGRGGKIQMKFVGDTVWMVTPAGCLLVWEQESSELIPLETLKALNSTVFMDRTFDEFLRRTDGALLVENEQELSGAGKKSE